MASVSAAPVPSKPHTATDNHNKRPEANGTPLATDHNVAEGPGWTRPPQGEEGDALDALISGVISGEVGMAEVSISTDSH